MGKKQEIIDAWVLLRSYIEQNHRNVSMNSHIYNAINILDVELGTTDNFTGRKIEHVCGLMGFGRGIDGKFDRCLACEARREAWENK